MCSVNPDNDDENTLMPIAEPIKSVSVCRKCKEQPPVVLLQSKFPYCKACFIEVVTHKFFGCLGKSKTMKSSDTVLLLCSGSQSSSVLLNLIKIGLHERQRKILSQAFILFIDCGEFMPLTIDERKDVIKQVQEMVLYFGFKSFYSPLVFTKDCLKELDDISWMTDEYLHSISNTALINSLKTLTAKEDLLVKMRVSAAANAARQLGCNKIFSADTNDHIATNILTNVALGRGDQLPLDIGFSDNRFKDVLILRPLRDCSRKEVAFYRCLHNLPFVSYLKRGIQGRKDESIQKLTEKFVAELQVSFPSTVCMVVGTGNKLSMKQVDQSNTIVCELCKGTLKPFDKEELGATSATHISHIISTLGSKGFNSILNAQSKPVESIRGNICKDKTCSNACNCSESNKTLHLNSIKEAFCYGCQLILNDLNTYENLPNEVLKGAQQTCRLKAMREEIHDYLL